MHSRSIRSVRAVRAVAAFVAAAIAAASDPAAAAPWYARPANPAELAGDHSGPVDAQLPFPVAIRPSRSCTFVLKLINWTDTTQWGIEVRIGAAVMRVPYLTRRQTLEANVPCAVAAGSATGSSHGPAIRVTARAELDVSALKVLHRTKLSTRIARVGSELQLAPDASAAASLLETILGLDDVDGMSELLEVATASESALIEIANAIEAHPQSALARAYHEPRRKLPAALYAKLEARAAEHATRRHSDAEAELADAFTILRSGDAEDVRDQHAAIPALCRGAHRVALWFLAGERTELAALRNRIRAACRPDPSVADQLRALTSALAARDHDTRLLDRELFASLVRAWRRRPPDDLRIAAAIMAADQVGRLEQLLAIVPAGQAPDVVKAIAGDEPADRSIAARRVKWVRDAIAGASGTDALAALAEPLFEARLARSPLGGLAPIVDDVQARLPEQFAAVRWRRMTAKRGFLVLDRDALARAGVDIGELHDFLTQRDLSGCELTASALVECSKVVKASGVNGLAALVPELVDPQITARIASLLGAEDSVYESASALVELGYDLSAVTARVCKGVSKMTLAAVEVTAVREFPGAAACVAARRRALRDAEHQAAATAHRRRSFGLVGLVAPVVVVLVALLVWSRRRSARDTGEDLALDPAPSQRSTGSLDRLATHLSNGLAAGLELARRDLGVAAVRPPVVTRLASTVARAVETGAPASILVSDGADTFYGLALPVRDVDPQVVRRYLGASWPGHVAELQRLAETNPTALIVLCQPDAMQARLLVGYTSGDRRNDPEVLLDAREARAHATNTFHHDIALTV